MNNEVLFTEKQKMNQWWARLILFVINALFLYAAYMQVLEGHQIGEKPMSNHELLFVCGLVILMTTLILNVRIETQIKTDGIYVKFFPFQPSNKHFTWEEISKLSVRQYEPVREYGGWGFRFGLFGQGKAYYLSGNMGLQLEFSDGKQLLIGTKKPEELKEVLAKTGHLK